MIPALIVLSILLLFLLTLVCVIKLRRTRREASKVTKSEENPSYDTYPHPDPILTYPALTPTGLTRPNLTYFDTPIP